jgi:hypothetical protein
MLSLYEAHDFNRLKLQKYRSQMQRFLTNVGCKLGWDHTPYEIDPESVYTEAFYESIIKSIIYGVKQTLSSCRRQQVHQLEPGIGSNSVLLALLAKSRR